MHAPSPRSSGLTFVLVHGAWAGGWAWLRTAEELTRRGHRVFAPTLSGLGERSHLAKFPVNLTTHVDDIVNEILWKDLEKIVLVGHSYGGFVITGVAERVLEKLSAIVYLDAFIPEPTQSFAELVSWLDTTQPLAPPPPSNPGDYLREEDRLWSDAKSGLQPTATLTEKLPHTRAYLKVPKKTYIQATGWDGPFGEVAATLKRNGDWTVRTIACGHDVPIDKPEELAELLIASAG